MELYVSDTWEFLTYLPSTVTFSHTIKRDFSVSQAQPLGPVAKVGSSVLVCVLCTNPWNNGIARR